MTSILEQGAVFLSTKRHESMSVAITYARGEADPIEIQATPGSPRGDAAQLEAWTIDSDRVDFIVRAGDLVIGAQTLPQIGDEITLVSTGGVYLVIADESERAYQWADEFRHDVRIHTRRKGE